ncbi:MAG TPA: hypothetical protein VGH22_09255 [Candidatus Binatia bacterium]|jgi:hypothetical protein
MSDSTLKILEESRKLREEIRTRRETLQRALAQSQRIVAAIVANTMSSITTAKRK